jgi:hypothetical protein
VLLFAVFTLLSVILAWSVEHAKTAALKANPPENVVDGAGRASYVGQPRTGSPQSIQIVGDRKEKAFHFVIDGKEVMRVDQTGMTVQGNIKYSGTIADDSGIASTANSDGSRHED